MIPQEFLRDKFAAHHGLSEAELQVVALVVDGKPTTAIATKLGISEDAVRKRLSEVYKKCKIEGRGPVKLARLQQKLSNEFQTQQEPTAVPGPPPGSPPTSPAPPSLDWGEAPKIPDPYGRQSELSLLQEWIQQRDRCRLVLLYGLKGTGKTTLAVHLAEQLATSAEFEGIVWRSLSHAPHLKEFLDGLLASLGVSLPPTAQDQRAQISQILEVLQHHRYLIILDDGECLLKPKTLAGNYREGYEDYGELFQRIGKARHQSCLILISTETINALTFLEGDNSPVRALQLEGLDPDAALSLLADLGLQPSESAQWHHLITTYDGNPLALKIVASTLKMLFGGSVEAFFQQNTPLVFQEIRDLVKASFERLSEPEVDIMYCLALASDSLDLQAIQNHILAPLDMSDLMQIVISLRQRSLIATDPENTSRFMLRDVVLEYVTDHIFEVLCQETCQLVTSFEQLQTQSTSELQTWLGQSLLARLKIFNGRSDSGFSRALAQLKHKLQAEFPNQQHIVDMLRQTQTWLKTEFLVKNTYATENIGHLITLLTDHPS
ncbi:NB-ARC domain-containing protein [Nodosilinea sp. P-1105]|uniref:NB-ARC domain-containing protein n=1 Tax=Nodosilinea sp. P-1105 TaxID=2546229 RepID=UPI001469D6DB|nr:NB-ARC domain-containing protein [Nodosilinea sp. P-1105]NMF83633.1 NACHT domain-containing protein [Nodosilinea sp. P-1105]